MEQTTRPFEDLIKEIEVEGERFIPAAKIAALSFNYNETAVKNKARMWVNEGYDCKMWYNFETNILKPKKHLCYIGISRDFNITHNHQIDNEEPSTNTGYPVSNQVQIFKLLMKWGFIE